MAKSVSWSKPSRAASDLLKMKQKAERPTKKQQVKVAKVEALQSISRKKLQIWPDFRQSLIANDIYIIPKQ